MSDFSRLRQVGAWAASLLILLIGLMVRLIDLTDPPVDFHPARQFHSALIARSYYAPAAVNLDEDTRARMVMLGATEPRIEPPIIEWITGMSWRIMGQDALWLPRLFSIIFWLAGGVPLLLLAMRLGGWLSAQLSLMIYVLLPYGVIASRSFQPDPLMVCLLLFAAWAGVRWIERPGWGRAILAGLLAGSAILVKQVAIFPLAGLLVGMILAEKGLIHSIKDRQLWLAASLALFPAVLYNIYGVWINGFLAGQYAQRFFPELWLDIAFYLRWAQKLDQTCGLSVVILAGIGAGLLASSRYRGMLIGWLIGYLVYGMTFAHHISTHDYYHLPLIPWMALAVIPLLDLLIQQVRSRPADAWARAILAAVVCGAALYAIYQARADLRRVDYRDEPAAWAQLGRQLGYESSAVMGLFDDYGARMTYWSLTMPSLYQGEVDQLPWSENQFQKISEEFLRLTEGKKYFVVSDFVHFDHRPLLKVFLLDRYPVLYQEKAYWVFNLQP